MTNGLLASMRVLHIMASGARGGGADHLLGLLPALTGLGVQVRAAVGTDGPLGAALAALGVHVTPLDVMGNRLSPGALWQVGRLCQRDVDVVHLHGTRAAFFAGMHKPLRRLGHLWARRARRPRFVYSAHGLAHRQAPRGVMHTARLAAERLACHGVDAVVSVSQQDLADLIASGAIGARPAVHIANAVNTVRFVPRPQRTARARLGLPADAPIIGTTSRLVAQKAVGHLLNAASLLPEAHVVVIGAGPLYSALLAHPLSKQGRVHLLGARDDVPEILPAFDVFALSSLWEGEPIALLEALACGIACVATATPGAREILQSGALGTLVPTGHRQALAAALQAALDAARGPEDAPATRAQHQQIAQGMRAMAYRSYDAQAKRVHALYTQLVAP